MTWGVGFAVSTVHARPSLAFSLLSVSRSDASFQLLL